ncbi:hypothetical protein HDE_03418 [Halotydeus destructor]|nr:hypothetical protein HDE_03418 [Halotydeus destructor]
MESPLIDVGEDANGDEEYAISRDYVQFVSQTLSHRKSLAQSRKEAKKFQVVYTDITQDSRKCLDTFRQSDAAKQFQLINWYGTYATKVSDLELELNRRFKNLCKPRPTYWPAMPIRTRHVFEES